MPFPLLLVPTLDGTCFNFLFLAVCWCLTHVILATQEAEIRRIRFEASPGKQFMRCYLEKTQHKKRADGVAGGVGLKFKPQHHKKQKQKLPVLHF
jgi:hypothetical protein